MVLFHFIQDCKYENLSEENETMVSFKSVKKRETYYYKQIDLFWW